MALENLNKLLEIPLETFKKYFLRANQPLPNVTIGEILSNPVKMKAVFSELNMNDFRQIYKTLNTEKGHDEIKTIITNLIEIVEMVPKGEVYFQELTKEYAGLVSNLLKQIELVIQDKQRTQEVLETFSKKDGLQLIKESGKLQVIVLGIGAYNFIVDFGKQAFDTKNLRDITTYGSFITEFRSYVTIFEPYSDKKLFSVEELHQHRWAV